MIKIEDPDYFAEVMQFALDNDCADKLTEKLGYLTAYHEGENTCQLYKDWAPYSFHFLMLRPDGTRWFNGGLIYSGPGQPLDGSAPALTVGIGIDSSRHGWTAHT